jgi:hypothetical protein
VPAERPAHLRPPGTPAAPPKGGSPSPTPTVAGALSEKDVDEIEKGIERDAVGEELTALPTTDAVTAPGTAPEGPLAAVMPTAVELPMPGSWTPRGLLQRRPTGTEPRSARQTGKEPVYDKSLLRALHATFWLRWWSAGMLSLCSNTLKTTAPLVNKLLLEWLSVAYAYHISGEVGAWWLSDSGRGLTHTCRARSPRASATASALHSHSSACSRSRLWSVPRPAPCGTHGAERPRRRSRTSTWSPR